MIKNHQLLHAIALYKHGSFRRASTANNISQPAFSRSIRNLEEELGVSLFDRQSVGAKPTLYGEVLLRRAGSILEEAEELEREIKILRGLEIGSFTVALGLYPAELSGSQAIGQMVLDHPDLRFRIGLSDWRNVANQVLTRSVDLGFAEISTVKSDRRLQTKLVGEHDLIFYCRRGHPLSGLIKVSKSDLDRYPVATVRLPDRMMKVFPGKTNYDEEKKCLNPSIVVEDLTTARAIVMKSDAFSAATPLQIEPWLHSGELRVLPYRAPWLKLNYGFISLRGRMLTPAAEVFMQLVERIEEELAPRNRELIQQIYSTTGGDE